MRALPARRRGQRLMARIRYVKPDFFTDADLCELPPLHRLLFEGLWCHADRMGRLEDRPRDLKVKILPFDEADIDAMLWDLHPRFVARYEVDGRRLLWIVHFLEHQRPHNTEPPSKLPEFNETRKSNRPTTVLERPERAPELSGMGTETGTGMGREDLATQAVASRPQLALIGTEKKPKAPSRQQAFAAWMAETRLKERPGIVSDSTPTDVTKLNAQLKGPLGEIGWAGLQGAYLAFLRDPKQCGLAPPWAFQFFVSQWRRYAPPTAGPAKVDFDRPKASPRF